MFIEERYNTQTKDKLNYTNKKQQNNNIGIKNTRLELEKKNLV